MSFSHQMAGMGDYVLADRVMTTAQSVYRSDEDRK